MTKPPVSILVAGGAGYVGSHTAKMLRQAGILPVVVDDLSTGNEWAVRFGPFVKGSITDRILIQEVLKQYSIDGAILFAAHAYVWESTQDPAKYYRNNVSGALALLETLLGSGVKRLVFSSSCSVYGIQARDGPIPEDSEKHPLSPYAETKLMLESVLRSYDRAYGLHSVCLRYFNAAGADPEGQIGECHDPETHLIPLTIQAALGGAPLRILGTNYPTEDGTAIRDYIHVMDLADAHVRALAYLREGGTSVEFNCGTGTGHSVRQVVEMVERVSGRLVPVELAPRREGDAPVLVADTRRIREAWGWAPAYSSLETIVRTAWRWHSSIAAGVAAAGLAAPVVS